MLRACESECVCEQVRVSASGCVRVRPIAAPPETEKASAHPETEIFFSSETNFDEEGFRFDIGLK